MINEFFIFCVKVLEIIGDATGMGYELANIVIFVIIPAWANTIIFLLWRMEKKKKS